MIICPTRSGSNYLSNLLNSHLQVKVLGELFSIDMIEMDQVKYIIENPIEFLEQRLEGANSKNIKALGFKMLYDNFTIDYFTKEVNLSEAIDTIQKRNQNLMEFVNTKYTNADLKLRFKTLWDYYEKDTDLKIIHLRRKNMLKTYLSLKRAFLTDNWMSIKKCDEEINRIHLDKNDLEVYFNRITTFDNHYKHFFRNHKVLDLYYEDIVDSIDEVSSQLFEFFEIDSVKLNSILKKQSKGNLRDNISNYDELLSHFNNSKWINFFEN